MPKKKKHYKCFWFLPCFLGCWWIASCLGAPLELTGWDCKQAEECGKKEIYRCRDGRCERRCTQAADCNGAATCREGWCIPNFLEVPVASNESPFESEISNEPLPTESTEFTPNEPVPTEPPPQEAEASPPTEPTTEPNTEKPPEIPNEIASDCGEDTSCPSRWVCSQGRCVPCQRDSDCSATYGGSCVGGSCEIAARQKEGVWQWSVGAPAVDCAAYRFPSAGYRAATQDGVYRIQPPRDTAFDVFCDMTYAGGGWTLLLKSDGSKNTFRYDAPLWNETTPYPAQPDPRNNPTEAKLRSYASVNVKELLFQMLDTNQPTRSLIVRHEGLSLHTILQSPENTPFQTPAGHANWMGLVRGGSLQANCRREGINVARNSNTTNGYITKLRLGILANNESDCGSIDSFTGIGAMYTTNASVFAGNANYYVGPNLPTVQQPRWTVILGRTLRQFMPLRTRDGAYEYDDGTQAPHCQAYHLPPAASFTNGVYWLKPPGQPAFRAYCLMDTHGGGWTLALKANGTRATFAYNAALWNNTNTHNPNNADLDTQEAKLPSFHQTGFSQILLLWQSLNGGTNTRRSLLLHKSASSLLALFQGSSGSFDYALGSEAWKAFADGIPLQTACEREGTNLSIGAADDAHVRIGLITDGASNCGSPNSRLGMGGSGQSCGQRADITVGASYGATCNNETSRHAEYFGMILVR